MTTPQQPDPETPQPRDIALEMPDERTAADLEEQSDPEQPTNPA
ncbi:hypothetical protein LY71_109158 [Geodermatophilus tzadiensis]|uniref:Uncharacterized protein n=1 Tax=Geodermatophilus tzadiensis TaxID=1137988 RepID=A0A2T0TS80_9ACTN|nr:hypothetical protein [Geodermatophilus tzadiensis]PRY48521.1 hypothetical protein LY71_109158 [Geodermatophilus tzadiensis]